MIDLETSLNTWFEFQIKPSFKGGANSENDVIRYFECIKIEIRSTAAVLLPLKNVSARAQTGDLSRVRRT